MSQNHFGRESGLLSRLWGFEGFLAFVFWVSVNSVSLPTDLSPNPPGGLWESRMLLEPSGWAQHPVVFFPQELRLHGGNQQQAQRVWWASPFFEPLTLVCCSFFQAAKEKKKNQRLFFLLLTAWCVCEVSLLCKWSIFKASLRVSLRLNFHFCSLNWFLQRA